MKIFAASAGGLRPKDTRGQFFLPKEGGFGAFSVSSARGFLSGRSALKYKRENRNFLYQTFLFRFLGFCLLRGGQEPNVGRGAVYTGIFVGTLATYAPIPAVFFSFSLLLSTSGRALVMLGPGAAHGCPPLSGACHRGAHQQKKTGGDPKSHVGAPGHYCSRGARRGVFFLLLPDAGALMGRRALGVASRGGAHPKWPL